MRLFSTKKNNFISKNWPGCVDNSQARATKQQARINRFHNLKKEVSGGVAETDLTMNFETSRIGKKVIEFQDVSFAYENKPILQDFNLLVQAKDRIGILGTTVLGNQLLLNLIAGKS